MKTIYLDLGMGAAGDMLSAAIYELLSDDEKKTFIDTMNNAGIAQQWNYGFQTNTLNGVQDGPTMKREGFTDE